MMEVLLVKNLPGKNKIAHADTWAKAWAMLQTERYQVVLLDLMLPDSPPEETVKRIPDILEFADAVCVVTGTGSRFREASMALGAFGHFEKHEALQLEASGFVESIARKINGWRKPTKAATNLKELRRVLDAVKHA